jgi:hypothetical protein
MSVLRLLSIGRLLSAVVEAGRNRFGLHGSAKLVVGNVGKFAVLHLFQLSYLVVQRSALGLDIGDRIQDLAGGFIAGVSCTEQAAAGLLKPA